MFFAERLKCTLYHFLDGPFYLFWNSAKYLNAHCLPVLQANILSYRSGAANIQQDLPDNSSHAFTTRSGSVLSRRASRHTQYSKIQVARCYNVHPALAHRFIKHVVVFLIFVPNAGIAVITELQERY